MAVKVIVVTDDILMVCHRDGRVPLNVIVVIVLANLGISTPTHILAHAFAQFGAAGSLASLPCLSRPACFSLSFEARAASPPPRLRACPPSLCCLARCRRLAQLVHALLRMLSSRSLCLLSFFPPSSFFLSHEFCRRQLRAVSASSRLCFLQAYLASSVQACLQPYLIHLPRLCFTLYAWCYVT